jgi:hypothetical protein
MSFSEFVDRNTEFSVISIVVLGIVAGMLGGMAIYAHQMRIMSEGGYIEVQTVGTTSTHWEKRP